jgi:hypothetical protein
MSPPPIDPATTGGFGGRAALLLILAAGACGQRPEAPELAFGAAVRVQAKSLDPGWHRGSVGTMGDCTVVMIHEPPDRPVRLYPIDFDDVTQVEVGDSAGTRWTGMPVEPLRAKHGGCF